MNSTFAQAFSEQIKALNLTDTVRTQALKRLEVANTPTMKDEEWRYTNSKPFFSGSFRPTLQTQDFEAMRRLLPNEKRLVLLNGRYSQELSDLPPTIRLTQQLSNHESPTAFVDLNTVFGDTPLILTLSGACETPLYLFHIITSDKTLANPRLVVRCQPQSQLVLIEKFISIGTFESFTNAFIDIVCEAGSVLEHYKIQRDGNKALHMSLTRVHQKKDSRYTNFLFHFGGRLSRNHLDINLSEPKAQCEVFGLYAARDQQQLDNYTLIDHTTSDCSSRELYKGIIDDQAHAVFSGRVFVRPHAVRTDAQQLNKNLLLSAKAHVNTKPQLQIYADDVKCSHGATTGQLDKEALFYLRSRGIDENQAKMILTQAFAEEIVSKVRLESLRIELQEHLSQWLSNGSRH